jgi:flagellar motor switch protein FliN/FliY
MSDTNLTTRSPGADANTNGSPLDLLMDVQLEATICFGERKLLLRDILSAGPGTLIELDRELEAPADLLVAGRLIARGQVVVVEGRFGLRITELVGPRNSSAAA